jgi:YfiR/HmsC-like
MLGRRGLAAWGGAAHVLLVVLGLLCVPLALADDSESLEYRVKAAFIYKFAGYVEWPPTLFPRPDSPIVIGVLGADAVAEELVRLVPGRTVNNRPVTVKRLKPGEAISGINILFIGKQESDRIEQLARLAQPQSLLSVTESERALANGSIINFVLIDRKVRFEISLESAEKSGLKLSSRLLAVAQQVHTSTP